MTPQQVVNAAAHHDGPRFVATQAYALTDDAKAVSADDASARYVLCGEGGTLPLAVAQSLGLAGSPGEQVMARRAIEAGDGSFRPVRG